jgi:hypothetical protein
MSDDFARNRVRCGVEGKLGVSVNQIGAVTHRRGD